MCWTRKVKRERKLTKQHRVKRIHPQPQLAFTTDEMIRCAGCCLKYKLSDIKINCAGCDQFYHCKVAGTCQGINCRTETNSGEIHRLTWCTKCVPLIPLNKDKQSRTEECICKSCNDY